MILMDKSAIHNTTLKVRELLTGEIRDLLQGIYGLDSKGNFEDVKRLPAVALPEVRATRKRLEKFLNDEEHAGLKRPEAVEKLVKETAFTHLNRLVAFKMMEARKLIRGTVDRYQESNAFKFYLAEHEDDLRLYEQGSLPQNEVGEGPRDMAYRHFLLWQCAELSKEIKVLFDPENLASRLFPRPRALKSLLEMLNDPALEEAWIEEETVGWIYQYFTEPDLAIFRGKNSPKVPADLLASRTQLFTHRWIVKFLVQNTIGRLWIQIHPDSHLAKKLDYLVPLGKELPSAPMKPARKIMMLDPACGTMHFGIVAFDLFAEIYLEEIKRAGSPGWPKEASVKSINEIPSAILAFNIYGIDIDLRAVQLSALALYLKAKSYNPKASITESNLACADVRLLDGSRLDEFIRKMAFTYPVYESVIRKLWSELKDIGQFGSLLQIEKEIENLVANEKAFRRPEVSLSAYSDQSRDAKEVEQDFWEMLDHQIIQGFDEFARQQAQNGLDSGFFVGEAVKGFKLLNILMQRFDTICTNPPYLDSRDYNSILKNFLELKYPKSKRNLYSAFVDRCIELLSDGGRLGIITGQSFMFISSFEDFRKNCLESSAIECLMQHDYGLFEARVDTAAYILRREPSAVQRNGNIGIYFRLIKESDSEAKRLRFEQALAHVRASEPDAAVFRYMQADFNSIPGCPWVYWITPGMRRMFVELPKLGEIAQPRVGLQTGDNFRFLRFWWEAGEPRVAFCCKSHEEAQASEKHWFPYMKGGSFRRWYGNQEYIINWEGDGNELKAMTPISVIRNPSFYFSRGVTWTDLTSGRFSARFSPGGFVFDVAGSHIFPEDICLVLGIMNSIFAQFTFSIINPTVHVQVGDLARLPIPNQSSKQLEHLVDSAISLAQRDSAEDETTFDFIAPPWTVTLDDTLTEIFLREDALKDVEKAIDEEVYRLYAISDQDRKAIESEIARPEVEGEEAKKTEPDYIDDEELARRWISYAVGIILGRFQPGVGALGQGNFSKYAAQELRSLADSDGVATLDEGHQDDLATKVCKALEIALGESGASEVVSTILGDGNPEALLRLYLERDFWKRHLQQYRKRPVYWLLQSPAKSFSVYVFHERATRDTLPLIIGTRYVSGKINQLKNRTDEVRTDMKSAEGRAKKMLEKELEELETKLLDLEAFEAAIRRVLVQKDERGETVGWAPKIDDGVILNLAPLRELMPSWKEPEKFWQELEEGKYDWSYTSMRYWPDRVLEKCKKNKSYAIAHGQMDVYEG